jgi:hypothetical protein
LPDNYFVDYGSGADSTTTAASARRKRQAADAAADPNSKSGALKVTKIKRMNSASSLTGLTVLLNTARYEYQEGLNNYYGFRVIPS